ncbi:MAG: hypothetical protein K1000chlam2_00726 [Chlamydiae bacterium]|nr:hypothetical protein [Chlamydiota bacterium]
MKYLFRVILLLLCVTTLSASNHKAKILVGSPIRQKPAILEEFLASLDRQEQNNYTLDYYFVDDNDNEESTKQLKDFSDAKKRKCIIHYPDRSDSVDFICNEQSHQWKEANIWRVAAFKDRMIQYAKKYNYDYLFFIDSDLVLHPHTINQLIEANQDIISNIFWTRWQPSFPSLPQVWLCDQYSLYHKKRDEYLSDTEVSDRIHAFLEKLKKPGVYEVGGLGACTLISKSALKKNINFKEIKNISFWGEDRHFCVRAAAIGLSLYVDTHYPAYHIFRESELVGVQAFKRKCELGTQRLTLAMVVKNEASRYLKRVLETVRPYITDAVINDDASVDSTPEICRELLHSIPHRFVSH